MRNQFVRNTALSQKLKNEREVGFFWVIPEGPTILEQY